MFEFAFPYALAAFLGSITMGLVLLWARDPIARIARRREDHAAVQASHVGDPLRLGGVGVFAGLMLGAFLLRDFSSGEFTALLLVAATPVFVAGLAEDLGYRVSPAGRFVAALISAGFAVALLGIWVREPGLPMLDDIFAVAPIAIPLTILLAGFYCHSVNLIDGMNGLSATVVISSALGISIMAGHANLGQISALGLLLAAATFGFFVLNWPRGFMLLGDAGAYGLGHLLIWLAIGLGEMAPTPPTASILLVLFWPLADTLHTIFRRLLAGKSVLEPDRMHLHQKIRRGLEITLFGRRRRRVSNPLTTLLMAPMITVPVVAGVMLQDNTRLAWIALLGFSVLFAVTHLVVPSFARWQRRSGSDTAGPE